MPLACPACRSEMDPVDFLGVKIDVCPQCAGIWFDQGELVALAKDHLESLEVLEEKYKPELAVHGGAEKLKKCPRCNLRLDHYRYAYDSPVQLDSCPNCGGIFVEDTELTAMEEAIKESDRARMRQSFEARGELARKGTIKLGRRGADGGIDAMIQALHHWREHSDAGA